MNAAELLPCFARPEGFHHGCRPDDATQHPHRPTPQPATGELKVDPEIRLRAGKFDLNVSFFYSSQSDSDQDYGRSRSASVAGHVLSATSGSIVTVVHGGPRKGLNPFPDTAVMSCESSCEKRCATRPSGSLAIRDDLECVYSGVSPAVLGENLFRFLGMLNQRLGPPWGRGR